MSMNLFNYYQRTKPRAKKLRGILRRAKRLLSNAERFSVTLSPHDWFHYSHEQLDWDGIGGTGPIIHRLTLKAHGQVFRAYAKALTECPKPFQLFLSLEQSPTGQDAVFIHSPNPHSEFPAIFNDVAWKVPELEALFSKWLPEFEWVAGKRDWNYVVYAKNVGLPLVPEP